MALWSWTLALIGALVTGMAQAQDKPAFVFTAIPDQDESRLIERFTKVAEQLQAKLGVPAKYIPVKSYPAAVTVAVLILVDGGEAEGPHRLGKGLGGYSWPVGSDSRSGGRGSTPCWGSGGAAGRV